VSLQFISQPTRLYRVHASPALAPGSWQDVGLGAFFGQENSTTANFSGPASNRKFYRVSAQRPLEAISDP
jgi:hypothetical protein